MNLPTYKCSIAQGVYVAFVKSIFNHPRTDNPEKDPGLYDWRRPAYKKDDVSQLNRLLKGLSKTKRNNYILPFRFKAYFNGSPNSRKQRVTFKLSYSHSLKAHKKYIETYMPQKNKDEVSEKPALFGSDIDEYNAHMVGTHFKCIISPESQNVDLQLLSRKFIERLERFTGYELYWEGCIHSNTDHRHAHIAINGVDRNGKKVFIPFYDSPKIASRHTCNFILFSSILQRNIIIKIYNTFLLIYYIVHTR